jgi:succinoglycan biosynthesis protein ExoA
MPLVSIIIPCYNEQNTIRLLLEAIYQQSYPRPDMEVIIADGLSEDGTRGEIANFRELHPDLEIRLVDNPRRIIPAALNKGLDVATGQYIVRLDAHSVPARDYIERCVADLECRKGENVGGVWDIRPGGNGWIARSIAVAASHPLGVGDASYRYTMKAGPADTVPFGAFRREIFEQVGRFNENLLTNEDYEFNVRIRQSGGKIWLNPAIRSTYFARPDLGSLARQYWRYGYWKLRMLRSYPATVRWRQFLPPLFIVTLFGLSILAIFSKIMSIILGLVIICYVMVILFGSIFMAWKNKSVSQLVGIPLAVATMHICWGSGFLWSMITSRK